MYLPFWLQMAVRLVGRRKLAIWIKDRVLRMPEGELVAACWKAEVSPQQWRNVEAAQAARVLKELTGESPGEKKA